MQVIQNNSLRFALNMTRGDRKRMLDLHQELKIDPLNLRIDRICNKMLNKMKDLYYIPKNKSREARYKYSDFEITNQPLVQGDV